jgi:hypothetical protein
MLTIREAATVLAALHYWREEMCPHGPAIMRPYFKHFKLSQVQPLTTSEIARLCRRLQTFINRDKL